MLHSAHYAFIQSDHNPPMFFSSPCLSQFSITRLSLKHLVSTAPISPLQSAHDNIICLHPPSACLVRSHNNLHSRHESDVSHLSNDIIIFLILLLYLRPSDQQLFCILSTLAILYTVSIINSYPCVLGATRQLSISPLIYQSLYRLFYQSLIKNSN